MTNKIFFTIALSVIFCSFACKEKKVELKDGINYFGAPITEDGATGFNGIEKSFTTADTINIKLSGIISEVCQSKGCWMNISDQKGESQILVRFKDYAYFMPKNVSGKKAIVEGRLWNNLTSVEDLLHLAKDKGAGDEEMVMITEPKREMMMMAEGVIIYN